VSETDDLVVSFSHRYHFETSDGTFWDGGVIEVSANGGNWSDVSKVTDPGYTGEIGDPTNQAKNTLKGRQGFVDHNASWPKRDPVTVDLGKAFAGKKIRIRFRVGTDDAAGDYGWELDDLAFAGIVNTPFTALVDDAASCGPGAPDADAGADITVHPGETVTLDGSASTAPEGAKLGFAWSQTQGVEVALGASDAPKTTFVAPATTAPTKLTFQLEVSSGDASDSDTVDVLVDPGTAAPRAGEAYVAGGGCDCDVGPSGGAPPLAASLALALAALARRRRRL
jgi:MYXO-CTERM domain-containing protein